MTATTVNTAELEVVWQEAKAGITDGIASLIAQDRLPTFQLEFPEVKRAYDAWQALELAQSSRAA